MVSAELQVNKITGLELEEGCFLVISPRIASDCWAGCCAPHSEPLSEDNGGLSLKAKERNSFQVLLSPISNVGDNCSVHLVFL